MCKVGGPRCPSSRHGTTAAQREQRKQARKYKRDLADFVEQVTDADTGDKVKSLPLSALPEVTAALGVSKSAFTDADTTPGTNRKHDKRAESTDADALAAQLRSTRHERQMDTPLATVEQANRPSKFQNKIAPIAGVTGEPARIGKDGEYNGKQRTLIPVLSGYVADKNSLSYHCGDTLGRVFLATPKGTPQEENDAKIVGEGKYLNYADDGSIVDRDGNRVADDMSDLDTKLKYKKLLLVDRGDAGYEPMTREQYNEEKTNRVMRSYESVLTDAGADGHDMRVFTAGIPPVGADGIYPTRRAASVDVAKSEDGTVEVIGYSEKGGELWRGPLVKGGDVISNSTAAPEPREFDDSPKQLETRIDAQFDASVNLTDAARNADMETAGMVGFDLETTGIEAELSDVLTSAVPRYAPGSVEPDSRETILAKPTREIPQQSFKVHGISNEHANAEGIDQDAAIDETVRRLNEAWDRGETVVGYNLAYDLSMLKRKRPDFVVRGAVFDPLVIERHLNPDVTGKSGSQRLTNVAKKYGVELSDDAAHDAFNDTHATVLVAQEMMKKPEVKELMKGGVEEFMRLQTRSNVEYAAARRAEFRKWDPKATHDTGWPFYEDMVVDEAVSNPSREKE